MSAISVIQSAVTMSSRDISSLVEVPHDSMLKTIRGLADKGVVSPNETRYQNEQNKQFYPEFHLTKRDALVIASGYNVNLRARIIDRWQELEGKIQSPSHILPQTFAEALLLAANQAAELEAARPAVQFVERYVQSTGNLGFRQLCKLLKAKENDFRAFLQDQRIMYRLGGDWVPYASHIDSGRFHVTTGTGDNDHNFTSAKFTPKGVEWVAKLWSEK